METHFALNDAEFEQQFASGVLDPALFSHEAHLRLAWIHIRKYGEEQAITNICLQLLNFTSRLGAVAKYNITVTVAAIKAVHHFLRKSGSDNFYEFIREFPRLKHNFRNVIATHYSMDIFKLEQAKQKYLEPDLLAFS